MKSENNIQKIKNKLHRVSLKLLIHFIISSKEIFQLQWFISIQEYRMLQYADVQKWRVEGGTEDTAAGEETVPTCSVPAGKGRLTWHPSDLRFEFC